MTKLPSPGRCTYAHRWITKIEQQPSKQCKLRIDNSIWKEKSQNTNWIMNTWTFSVENKKGGHSFTNQHCLLALVNLQLDHFTQSKLSTHFSILFNLHFSCFYSANSWTMWTLQTTTPFIWLTTCTNRFKFTNLHTSTCFKDSLTLEHLTIFLFNDCFADYWFAWSVCLFLTWSGSSQLPEKQPQLYNRTNAPAWTDKTKKVLEEKREENGFRKERGYCNATITSRGGEGRLRRN